MREAALVLLAVLALAGCRSVGPIGAPDFLAQASAELPAEERASAQAYPIQYLNIRQVPTFAEALLLGRRLEESIGAAVLTPQTLHLLAWNGSRAFYVPDVTIPTAAIIGVEFRRMGLGSVMTLETREPMHIRLGAPAETGFYRINVLREGGLLLDNEGTEALAEAIRRAMPGTATAQR